MQAVVQPLHLSAVVVRNPEKQPKDIDGGRYDQQQIDQYFFILGSQDIVATYIVLVPHYSQEGEQWKVVVGARECADQPEHCACDE